MVKGNDIWVLKEKIKLLKGYFKVWNNDTFGDINKKNWI